MPPIITLYSLQQSHYATAICTQFGAVGVTYYADAIPHSSKRKTIKTLTERTA